MFQSLMVCLFPKYQYIERELDKEGDGLIQGCQFVYGLIRLALLPLVP